MTERNLTAARLAFAGVPADFNQRVRDRERELGAKELFENVAMLHEDLSCNGAQDAIVSLSLALHEAGKIDSHRLLQQIWDKDAIDAHLAIANAVQFLCNARRKLIEFHEPSEAAQKQAFEEVSNEVLDGE